jgi:hypothetical protein
MNAARQIPASDVKGGDLLVAANNAEVFDTFPDGNDRTIIRIVRNGDASTAYVFPSSSLVAIR